VQHYHGDNGVFTAKEFQEDLDKEQQGITLSGIGAHHQNGIAERAIRTMVTKARVLLLHVMLRWPEITTSDLWPMAIQHAEYLCNRILRTESGLSSGELFMRTVLNPLEFQQLPVWGCPAYVLDPKLQDGRKLPKWQSISRRGQYVGKSPKHLSTVHLVRNLSTGSIGPQYHLVFDNWFETIHVTGDEPPPQWEFLLDHSRYLAPIDDDDWTKVELADDWLTASELIEKRACLQREREKDRIIDLHKAASSIPDHTDGVIIPSSTENVVGFEREPMTREPREEGSELQREQIEVPPITPSPRQIPSASPSPVQAIPSPVSPVTTPRTVQFTEETKPPASAASPVKGKPAPVLRRSARARQAPKRHGYDGSGIAGYLAGMANWEEDATYCSRVAYFASLMENPQNGELDLLTNELPDVFTMALKAKKQSDPDLPNYQEAMRGPHKHHFLQAMADEIKQLQILKTWFGVKRSSLPPNTIVLPSTWAFRIKRLPNQSIHKFKARFCVHGAKQLGGADVFETFAPVVQWSTVRCLLAFALQEQLVTRQVDFSNAFVQAMLPSGEHIFIEPPKDFPIANGEDTVLKLNKSLYGLKQAPYHWFNKLKEALEKHGLKQSKTDQCMFVHPNGMIVLCYVDDLLLFHKSDSKIKELLDALRADFALTEEQIEQDKYHDVYSYLGIEVDMQMSQDKKRKPVMITLKQSSLIKKVLKATSMEDCNAKETPAREKPLGTDKDGPPFEEHWDYASVIGMLMYLVNTRPDIQFSVHQCARFTHCPRASHAEAVRRICRYLKGTCDQGLQFAPKDQGQVLQLDCYVDADFSGLFGIEDSLDPVSSKSRTGYVFRLGNCPVLWVSRLQQETTLSTTEAEYVAMSQAMRDLLPMRQLVLEIAKGLKVATTKSTVFSKVFEDNKGAIAVAKAPSMTSRTRHINCKYHFFRSHIGEDKGIVIEHIDTEEQIADIFTKGLIPRLFQKLRKLLMGW